VKSLIRFKMKDLDGGLDRTRICDLLRVNLSVLAYIADSFRGLLVSVRPLRVSTALIEQHSEQQFDSRPETVNDLNLPSCTTAIVSR
jgi:hypothetical protein